MNIPKACGVLAMAALLGLALGGSGFAAGASDQVPREWKEMSFEDIDVSPFSWVRGEEICRVMDANPVSKGCVLMISGLHLLVRWYEREPPRDCDRILTNVCRGPLPQLHSATSTDRAVSISPVLLRKGQEKDYPPFAQLMPIYRDIIDRLELYAIPCSCGGVPVKPVAKPASPAPPSRAGGGDAGLPPRAELPPGRGAEVPYILGQSGGKSGIYGNIDVGPGGAKTKPRAMKRTGGFPPDVQVTALRFYPSPYALVPREKRAYSTRFDDRVEYVNVELNLVYPARAERFPFKMDVMVLKDGSAFTTFTQTDMSLEPGWTDSFHSAGWGKEGGGVWSPGRYRVEVSVKGEVVATGEFEVVGSR